MDVYQRRRLVALSVIAAIFVIIVLLIRSCGDDEEAPLTVATGVSGATGAAGPLSQEDYVDQADAICLQVNTTISNIDEADANEAASQTGDALASELNQLQSLPAPSDGEDELDKFLAALEDQVAAYEDRETAVNRGDDTAVAEIDTTIDESAEKAERTAGRFGFDACGDTSKTGGGSSGGGGESASETTTDSGSATAPEPAPVPTTPTTTTPVPTTPVPTTPTEPAPSEGGGATPAPAPPATDGDSGSGGVSP
ncbi:MAG: hypothetical protein GEU88_02730 [Solirubrobacterales bacterium]|nr:hypothetical protein [Solirubrobacterales bacterium]